MANEIAQVIGTIERVSRKCEAKNKEGVLIFPDVDPSKGNMKFYGDNRWFIVDNIDDPNMPPTETEILLTYEFWDYKNKTYYRAKNIRPTEDVDEVELEGVERIKS